MYFWTEKLEHNMHLLLFHPDWIFKSWAEKRDIYAKSEVWMGAPRKQVWFKEVSKLGNTAALSLRICLAEGWHKQLIPQEELQIESHPNPNLPSSKDKGNLKSLGLKSRSAFQFCLFLFRTICAYSHIFIILFCR